MKIGDVVMLASGGPEMTVVNFDAPASSWICAWFEKNRYGHWNRYTTNVKAEALVAPMAPEKIQLSLHNCDLSVVSDRIKKVSEQ